MQLFVLFWIALCLVADTSTKSVSSTDDETNIGDLSVPLHADGNQTAEECKCEHGFCEKNDKGRWVCKCPPEWGLYSATTCKKCDCGKDSNCTFFGFWATTKTCLCKVGYKDVDGFCKGDCSQNPCKNGGTCQVTSGEVTCQCKDGFGGEDCSIEECQCENGVCERNDKGRWVCKCPPQWGLYTLTFCKKCNCGKDSNCTYPNFFGNKKCNCKEGYKEVDGTCEGTCQTDSDCLNGGKCGRLNNCKCLEGTEGDLCEEISECKNMNCEPEARCTYDVAKQKATCSCENQELLFDSKVGKCRRTCYEHSDCTNGAECEENGTGKFCSCLNGTEGDFCEQVSECTHLDCGPDARCTYDARREKAMCSCENQDLVFDDKERRCKNVCYPNPCKNGGTCNATRGEATCQCKDRFRGADCSIDVCSPNPCKNDGTCNATRGEATCQCKDRFRGVDCSIDVCYPNPCQNGGVCNVTRKGAICQCRDHFRGADCSIEIPVIATSTTPGWTMQPTSSNRSLNFTVGRESTLRLTTIVPTTGTDPCTESPCQNGGTCVTVGNTRKCLCKKPYLGNLCETDPCDWNPCKNGGMCKIEYETARCFCREPFTGEFCESVNGVRSRIDTSVIALFAGTVLLTALLTFVTCILCQRYHVMRSRSEYS